MKIAIIGLGYWGPNLVRNFVGQPGVEGVVCFDVQAKKLEKIRHKFPMVEALTSYDEILKRPDITAVAIVTPASTHYSLGLQALEAGKHLLLEKPMATTAKEAEHLIAVAEKNNLRILVDHTFVYTGAVKKIKELIDAETVGDVLYFDSVRVNLGLFQHDTNVIWDLAPHDISIMHYVIPGKPRSVHALGVNHYNGVEDMAYITVQHDDKLMSHFHVNWLSPVKIRRILIGGSKHMIVYDDMQPSEKVRVYDKGVEITEEESLYRSLVQYRIGDMFAPRIEESEALSLMAAEFIQSITNGTAPVTDGKFGYEVVRVLEAANQSLRNGGQRVFLED